MKAKKSKWPGYIRNEDRLKLLVALPKFERDLLKIRAVLGISQSGFDNAERADDWYIQKVEEARKSQLPGPMQNVAELGKKYSLPANFYTSTQEGLFPYITQNIFRAPMTHFVIEVPHNRPHVNWISLKTFGPLNQHEIKLALKELSRLQQRYLSKEINLSTRRKKQLDRDIELLQELSARQSKPVRRKTYSGYLKILQDRKSLPPKKKREMERMHKRDVSVSFSEITSRKKGRKLGMSADAARKALERINALARQLFGDYAVDDKQNN